jgi:hypothetical protein
MGLTDKIGVKGLIVGAGLLALTSGCNRVYTRALARGLGETALRQATVSSVRNKIEGPRGTTVNNYSQGQVGNNPYLVFSLWKDFNGNKRADSGEIIGIAGSSVNMDNVGLHLEANNNKNINSFIVMNSKYEVIQKINTPSGGMSIPENGMPPGDYIISGQLRSGGSISGKISITK